MPTSRDLAVMFTDMKGFTARTAASSERDLLKLLREHDQLILPILEQRGGVLIKTIGDALMMSFESPWQAVRGAIEVQQALTDFNSQRPRSQAMELRIGIHCGQVTEVDGDLFGDTVNTAARIESAAAPGSVSFSAAVHEAIKGRPLSVIYQGKKRFKGLAKPIGIYKVRPLGRKGSWQAALATVQTSFFWTIAVSASTLLSVILPLAVFLLGMICTNITLVILSLLFALTCGPFPLKLTHRLLSFIAGLSLATVMLPERLPAALQNTLHQFSSELAQNSPKLLAPTRRLAVYTITSGATLWDKVQHKNVGSAIQWAMVSQTGQNWQKQQSDILMNSPAIRNKLRRFIERLLREPKRTQVTLETKSLRLGTAIWEAGLPLRSVEMSAQATLHEEGWQLEIQARGRASFNRLAKQKKGLPPRLVSIGPAGPWRYQVDTALLANLEQHHWLSPTWLELQWHIRGDDPRLEIKAAPLPHEIPSQPNNKRQFKTRSIKNKRK